MASSKKRRVVLIDGNAVFHRGYHAIPPSLKSRSGEQTNAIYGFTLILLQVLKDLKPDFVLVAWDKAGKTFRDEIFTEYKATRPKEGFDDLYAQMPRAREVLEAFRIPLYEVAGYEADDVIGTLSQAIDDEVIIVTGDMDELQLVNDHVKVFTMRRGFTDTVIYDEAAVKEKYGFGPRQIIDFKALRGDASDNIPGVPGIGEVTAKKLLSEFGTLEGIYKNLGKVAEKTANLLMQHKESADLSYKLATIVCDVQFPWRLEDGAVGMYDKDKVFELFQELNFQSLLAKLPEVKGAVSSAPSEVRTKSQQHLRDINYVCVSDEKSFGEMIRVISKAEALAIDTETDSLNPITCRLVGMSFCADSKTAYYLPLGHTLGKQLPVDSVKKELHEVLTNPKIKKVGHNLKFDYKVLRSNGFGLDGIYFDTMIASFVAFPDYMRQDLSGLAFAELGIEMIPITQLIGPPGKKQLSLDKCEIEKTTVYAGEDAYVTFMLYKHLDDRIVDEKLRKLFTEIEMPLTRILAEMELMGIKLDIPYLLTMSKRFDKTIKEIENRIYEHAGMKFNISSLAQLKEILFTRLQISTQGLKRSKTGISTAAKELEKLRGVHPIIDLIFEYRELTKLKSTYIDTLPEQVDENGRVHTDYSQTVAQTGRLSSNNPNLQNIPIRTEIGREIRAAFIPGKGFKLMSCDYSQFELRIAAHLSGDPEIIKAFKAGKDFHTSTAALVMGVSEDKVPKEARYAAKAVNFGILYGLSAHGLSVGTGMGRAESQEFIDKYFSVYKKLKAYIDQVVKDAHDKGYAETLFGRRRYFPDINSSNFMLRSSAERMAMNMPIQGTQADVIKLAMIELAAKLPKEFPNVRMLLQVHDELVFEVPEKEVKPAAKFIKGIMEGAVKLDVPVIVEPKVGDNWNEVTVVNA